MNTRPLTETESANLAALNDAGVDSVLLFVTPTGIRKAILDVTEPMRRMFVENGFHDFAAQQQGPNSKVQRTAIIWDRLRPKPVIVSLYRPQTKKGDPRMWPADFRNYAAGNEVFAAFFVDREFHLLNLSRGQAVEARTEQSSSPLGVLLERTRSAANSTARELLKLLRAVAQAGPIRAVCIGDTAVGRSIEHALGIPMNSSKRPDFKGIEIKAGRSTLYKASSQSTLFACVPDWSRSVCKSSEDILERFGYDRDGKFKLRCEVWTRSPNSQGLQLKMNEPVDWLREISTQQPPPDVCIWSLSTLHQRLLEKHKETFWVQVDCTKKENVEWFQLRGVMHTHNPSTSQFDRMIEDGTITMHHLIERLATGRAHEKGPLFRIERRRLDELFLGKPKDYSLIG